MTTNKELPLFMICPICGCRGRMTSWYQRINDRTLYRCVCDMCRRYDLVWSETPLLAKEVFMEYNMSDYKESEIAGLRQLLKSQEELSESYKHRIATDENYIKLLQERIMEKQQ